MQASLYEYLKKTSIKALSCEDLKEARSLAQVAGFLGYEVFVLDDLRALFLDDLRSYKSELQTICLELFKYQNCQNKKLLISPISSLKYKYPKEIKTLKLELFENKNPKLLAQELLRSGYEQVDIVEQRGEFAFRNDRIDVFSLQQDKAFRILFDDDLIESIRELEGQKSIKIEIEKIEILPLFITLNEEDFLEIERKIDDIEGDFLLKDYSSFGFWFLQDLFSTLPLDFLDIKNIEKPKNYKEANITLSENFFLLNEDKKILLLAKNEAMAKYLEIEKYQNVELLISPFILNICSKDEYILSLNKYERKEQQRKASLSFNDLKPRDYVVHENYGIGQFLGLKMVKVEGKESEFIELLYQNNDKLLIPMQNIYLIDKYISSSIAILDRLGKSSFIKMKEKLREKLFIIANELVNKAAQRALIKAPFIKQPLDYFIFQNSAGFVHTKDQKIAIEEIFKDLAKGTPMDRLLSADVGFGKTEVAMNAIFACVKSGFSALFVVPTTLLSNQHFKSLKNRFKDIDINIFKLDRNSNQKKAILEAISSNKAFIALGTHSLLSLPEIKNLALLVIDEEHKFGVKQKERLKELSMNAHLLSMSATPIPRSLNHALSKIKSYSTILTPPEGREDIKTFVREKSDALVKEAILRELRRAGQIFYIHNHIASIEVCKKYIESLVKNIKILVLHGKIDAKESEKEMADFEEGKYDILLSTSIVESGIDLPRVNTVIIENSNNFGLADLHQLRGRVGRGQKQGYCYLLVDDKEAISQDAKKRLVSMESNSYLGSGSVLAYHDLEIRGGGNLLGAEQSGHIEQIGYSLYLKMLEDEINKLTKQDLKELSGIDLKLSVSAYINQDLVREDTLRLDIYKRLASCKNKAEIFDIESELIDRFGALDTYTKQFLKLMQIKLLAENKNIKLISSFEQNIKIVFATDESMILKAESKDDDSVLNTCLEFLQK